MTKKIGELESLLAELSRERDELEAAIETMIAELADVPDDERKSGDWAPDGASTKRYLELTHRQTEVEQDIVDLTREMAATKKPPLPN